MVQLADVLKQAKELSEEDRKGLVAYLLHGMSGLPTVSDDEEVGRIAERAAKGSQEAFLKAMSMVPAGEAVAGDEIPAGYKQRTPKSS